MSALADRIKSYEVVETARQVPSGSPIVIRVDGNGFSKFTKGMSKPFDKNFLSAMEAMTQFVVSRTDAVIGYTQSDEATFILKNDENKNTLFGARIPKLTSIFSSLATAGFLKEAIHYWPELCAKRMPVFDARVFGVPSPMEAYNAVLSRELDATKNAISMLASYHFSHKSLLNKTGEEKKVRLLEEVGVSFDDLPDRIKRGVYVRNMPRELYLSAEELDAIPEKFRPVNPVMRKQVVSIEAPPLLSIENKVGFILEGEDPVVTVIKDVSTNKNKLKAGL